MKGIRTSSMTKKAKVQTFVLTYNHVTTLDKGFFDNMPNLLTIYLFLNKLQTIDENIFKPLTKLKDLDLSQNQLKSLSFNFWRSLAPTMTNLQLYSNQIAEIPNGSFDNIKNLTLLRLDNNKLISFVTTDLKLKSPFKHLNLENNQIKKFSAVGLKNLNTLNLDRNQGFGTR
jgi:keratocan